MTLNVAHYLNISEADVQRLKALAPQAMYADAFYQSLITQLDSQVLHDTAGDARAVYAEHLEELKAQHGLTDSIMSGHTLVNWVLGFLMYPDKLGDMIDRHANVASHTITETLPDLINMLAEIPSATGQTEWQRALVLFTLPLTN
ncbi:MAG: hypothetical protein JXA10_16775 [Anaerolineae bacterium]|nr:hypothetical protein [Anaerolineae bacterium]